MCAYHTVCDETKWIELNDYSRKYPAPSKIVMECVCVGGGALTAIYFRNKKKTYSTGLLATFSSLLEVKGGGGYPNTYIKE